MSTESKPTITMMSENDEVRSMPRNAALANAELLRRPGNSSMEAIQHHCRVPSFAKNSPDLWILQVESVFKPNRVTSDDTKYYLTVAALDLDAMRQLHNIVSNPPATNKYSTLKTCIFNRFSDSADRQLHKVLSEIELRDKKPSELLRLMQNLAGNRAVDDVIRVRWLALLPPKVQQLFKIFRSNTLDELATAAHELLENRPGPSVMATGFCQTSVLPHRNS